MSSRIKRWLHRLFPRAVDFLQLLDQQAEFTQHSIQALGKWSADGDMEALDSIIEIEQQSDALRTHIVDELFTAFETPLDREDLNDLSRKLDDIVDSARNTQRKIRTLHLTADATSTAILLNIDEGLDKLRAAIKHLPADVRGAWNNADAARHTQRLTEELEAQGLAALLDTADVARIFRGRELYMLLAHIGHVLETVGENMSHAINKIG